MELPHLAKIKKGVQLLAEEASNHAFNGRLDEATDSLLAGIRLTRSIEKEPLFISFLVQVAGGAILQRSLEEIMDRQTLSEADLRRLEPAFLEMEGGISLARAFAGERCMGLSVFQLPAPQAAAVIGTIKKSESGFDMAAYRQRKAFRADMNFYLDYMASYISAASLPYPDCIAVMIEIPQRLGDPTSKGYFVSGLLLHDAFSAASPLPRTALSKAADGVGRTRLARAALAVELFRLANTNALPDTISILCPDYVSEILKDPYDGQPLRLRPLPRRGFVVYSIGPDRTDDRGTPRPKGTNLTTFYDLTFTVGR